MKNLKRFLSLALAVLMMLSYVPTIAYAEGLNLLTSDTEDSGNSGEIVDTDNQEVDNDEGTATIDDTTYVAKIGDVGYETLQAAIDAAVVAGGEVTITLSNNVTESVTINEKVGLYLTIDGEDKTMNGTVTVNALSDTNDNRRITIKNINFVDDADTNIDFISSVDTNHYPCLTIEDCSFTGSGNDGDVAIRLKSSHSVIIKDCTGTGLHSFLQNTSGWNLSVENVTVDDSKGGIALGTVQGVTVKGCKITTTGYGIRIDAEYNNNAVIENCEVNAFIPVVVRKAKADSSITFNGTNTMTETNTEGLWCAIGVEEYGDVEKEGLTTNTGKVVVALNDAGLDADGVYGSYAPVAQIGETKYETLAAAIAAANAGDTITLLANVAENVTVNKSLTIDGAEKNYTGNISVTGSASSTEVTVKNINFVNGTGYAVTTNTVKKITVENCTVTNYGYGFLYANKSTPTVEVKNVTVERCYYGFHWVYGTSATLENVTMTNVTYGLYIQNYAGKTITVKNSNISSIEIWERDGYSGVQTFKFEGANTVGTLSDSKYAKYVLVKADATLKAPEGATVTTEVADSKVVYKNGAYSAIPYVEWVQAELFAGNDVTLDRDIVIEDYDLVHAHPWPSNGNGTYNEAHGNGAIFHIIKPGVELDLNGHSITWDAHDDDYCNKRQVSLFMVTATGNAGEPSDFTVKDSVGTGKVDVYGMGSGMYVVLTSATGTIEGGTWTNYPCKTCSASNIFIYPSHGGTLNITGGTFEQKDSEYLIGLYGSSEETTDNGVGVDYDQTKVNISGGTLVGMNPSEIKFFDMANSDQETINGCADGYGPVKNGKSYGVMEIPDLPTATVTKLENDDLTFALNFKADKATENQLAYYGGWYADYVLTVNKDVTFNADSTDADGYLSGQYDEWSENWVNVPFEDVILKANEPIKIMESAAELVGQSGLKLTYNDVYNFVKDFNCGVYFNPEFLATNTDFKVTLELRMYNPDNEEESYAIGKTYEFNAIVAEYNEKRYATVDDALTAAMAKGGTVKMINNSNEANATMMLVDGVTLDLNGYELSAGYIASFNGADIVDNSEANTGRLNVNANKFMISENNKQLPVNTEDGYAFIEIVKMVESSDPAINGGYDFAASIRFEAAAVELLKAGYEKTGVSVVIRVSWVNSKGELRSQDFVYGDEHMNDVLNSFNEATEKFGKMFILNLTNAPESVAYKTIITSNTDVEYK